MSKELEAFAILKQTILHHTLGCLTTGEEKALKVIETALKNYQELLERPCVLVGRTSGHTKALIDKICKNYKEIKITNLEDEKKIKALEIITSISKQTTHFRLIQRNMGNDKFNYYLAIDNCEYRLKDKEEYDLLKEVLL